LREPHGPPLPQNRSGLAKLVPGAPFNSLNFEGLAIATIKSRTRG